MLFINQQYELEEIKIEKVDCNIKYELINNSDKTLSFNSFLIYTKIKINKDLDTYIKFKLSDRKEYK